MAYRVLADLVVATHLVFMLYALFGGLLRLWKTWSVFVHAPTAIWIAVVAFRGWICPLTPLENTLRFAAGEAGYEGSFVEHYLIPVIYPSGLTRANQSLIGVVAVAVNIAVYVFVFYRLRQRRSEPSVP